MLGPYPLTEIFYYFQGNQLIGASSQRPQWLHVQPSQLKQNKQRCWRQPNNQHKQLCSPQRVPLTFDLWSWPLVLQFYVWGGVCWAVLFLLKQPNDTRRQIWSHKSFSYRCILLSMIVCCCVVCIIRINKKKGDDDDKFVLFGSKFQWWMTFSLVDRHNLNFAFRRPSTFICINCYCRHWRQS